MKWLTGSGVPYIDIKLQTKHNSPYLKSISMSNMFVLSQIENYLSCEQHQRAIWVLFYLKLITSTASSQAYLITYRNKPLCRRATR